MKCIYRERFDEGTPHCDKKADYIYLGKSYCAEHMEVRSAHYNELIEKERKHYEKIAKEIT